MASGPSVQTAQAITADYLSTDLDVRLWTASPGFDGSGGTEVTGGGYTPAPVALGAAVPGTAGVIARATNLEAFSFDTMPVPSSAVSGISLHRSSTGALVWLEDSWSPPGSWSAGESPQIGAGKLTVAFLPSA